MGDVDDSCEIFLRGCTFLHADDGEAGEDCVGRGEDCVRGDEKAGGGDGSLLVHVPWLRMRREADVGEDVDDGVEVVRLQTSWRRGRVHREVGEQRGEGGSRHGSPPVEG